MKNVDYNKCWDAPPHFDHCVGDFLICCLSVEIASFSVSHLVEVLALSGGGILIADRELL